MVGVTSGLKSESVEAHVVAMNFAKALGGKWGHLPAPAFLPVEQAEEVINLRPVRRTLTRIESADVVVTSMGPIPENVDASEITITTEPKMNEKLFELARAAGAIGEICYGLFDRHGKQVKTTHKGLGLGFEGLRAIAQDPEGEVVLICGGDRLRFEPLRVALEAKLASVLVSDTVTARYLVGELDETREVA